MSSQVGSAAADTEQCDTPMELANTPPQLGLLADSDDTYSSPSPLSTLHVEDDISDITAPDYSPVVSMSSTDSSTSFSEAEESVTPQIHSGHMAAFKIVGDNIDKTVRPRDMRLDRQSRSLHYFNSYAVKDRVDFSSLEDNPILPSLQDIDVSSLLPTEVDIKSLKGFFAIHVARVLKKYMAFFSKFGTKVERHIIHEYSDEMATKSEVVSN